MVDEPLPPEFQFGKVVGRVIRAVADTAEDIDALPQARPATGTVTFTPRQSLRVITTPGDKTFVTAAAETVNLSAAGRIIDAEGRQGIWLVTGVYDVKFDLTGGMGLPSMVIEVTTDHTDDAPLDLVDDASYVPPPRTPVQTLLVPVGGTDGYVLSRSGSNLAWVPQTAPDATTSAKGIVRLSGDLGGTAEAPTVPALASKADSTALAAHIADQTNPHVVTKAQVGLGNVDNTSDLAKPVSTATQTAINAAIAALVAGAPGALDTLNELATQLGSDESAASALTTLVGAIRNLTDSTHVAALGAAFLPRWQPITAYTAGDVVMAPDGTIVSRNSDGTSGSSYTSANWTTVGGAVSSVNGLTGTVVIDEVSIVVYSGSVGTIRPSAEFVVWQGYPTQPTNMADGDLWLSDLGGTVLSGAGAPTSGDGANGDFWIRTSNSTLYGPKAAGAWPSGVSLVGAAGTNGTNGTNGRGITSIARTSGTGAAGTTDTYTITYSDSTTSTYTVVNGADGAGSSITVQDEGGALATAATTINFVGSGVTATGTGATKTVTIPGGGSSGNLPANSRYTQPTGAIAVTFDRTATAIANQTTWTSGALFVAAVSLSAGDVISAANAKTSGSGLATVTHSWAVLLDASRNVVAVSADDTTATVAANTKKTWTFGSPYTVPTSGLYYTGHMVVGGTINLYGVASSANIVLEPPILCGISSTGQTTPPSLGATMSAVSPSTSALAPWIWLT